MARIRSIKPEFWTDEILVQLPYEARLLFIGLWNFADDYGAIPDSPERIRLQVMPADHDADVDGFVDLLVVVGLLDRYRNPDGLQYLQIRNWAKHQKVDKPSQIRTSREGSRKVSIPFSERQGLARKYGCEPGGEADANCYYCGEQGRVHWTRRRDGKPSGWVYFSGLEIDHFVAEADGGQAVTENFVLACRRCNRTKQTENSLRFALRRSGSPRESSRALSVGSDGSEGMEGSEGAAGTRRAPRALASGPPPEAEELTPAQVAARKKAADDNLRTLRRAGVDPGLAKAVQ